MKTFDNLIEEVHNKGLCHQCGGCVSFCSAVNYGALEMSPDGPPRYADEKKCIECGLCYLVCPEVGELMGETKARLDWEEPMGKVLQIQIARAKDPTIRELATDGGAVTALLLNMFDTKRIDSAIVSRQVGPFQRLPHLARSRRGIILSAGSSYGVSSGTAMFGSQYSTYAPASANLDSLKESGLSRVAMVGVPDQITTMRKMQTMNVTPSDRIKYYFGLFCSRNFQFGEAEREQLEHMGRFAWDQVMKVNLKEELQIHLYDGSIVRLPLDELEFMTRHACRYCRDYSAELSDISFGGVGAPEGWTTVVIRTPEGLQLYNEARGKALEEMDMDKMMPLRATARELITHYSQDKRAKGLENRRALEAQPVEA